MQITDKHSGAAYQQTCNALSKPVVDMLLCKCMSFCKNVFLPTCIFANKSFCKYIFLQICLFANMSFYKDMFICKYTFICKYVPYKKLILTHIYYLSSSL